MDALLSQRSDSEHDASRRMKTEFLTQFDGLNTDPEERLFVIGATNRPQEIDEAARRRFTKRLFIPLPETEARMNIVSKCLGTGLQHSVSPEQLDLIGKKTKGFSGGDVKEVCRDAAQKMVKRCAPVVTKKSKIELNKDKSCLQSPKCYILLYLFVIFTESCHYCRGF